ncbi:MAG: DUF86 domain-containing protein [Candidatus Freyrarchaeum guaymaensis]
MSIQTVTMASLPYDEFMGDLRNRYTLRLAILEIVEAAISMGLHILREKQEAEKIESYSETIEKLVEVGVVSAEVGDEVAKLVGLRNLIAHRYWEVDDSRIYREARGSGLEIIKRFVREVEERVLGD